RLPCAELLRDARRRGSEGGVDAPLARYALELVDTAVLEGEARAGDEILDRLRDEYLARSGERGDPRSGVDCDAADLLPVELALARVDAGADLHAELPDRLAGRDRAADGARRTVEAREEAVASGVDLPAAKALELAPHGGVVSAQELAPAAIAKRDGAL